MEAELQTRVNLPVVLVNREGLYVIIAVLGVSILGCAGVLTYSFTNHAKLKRNAEEVRSYIASRVKAADQLSGGKQVTAAGAANARPTTIKAAIPLAAGNGLAVETLFSSAKAASENRSVNGTLAAVTNREISATHVGLEDLRKQSGANTSDSSNTITVSTGTATVGVANRG
ncbi:hypothetical protein HPB52_019064 [Rhipicephalus sanguineus]|uniref:Uncharacterized protein n=1 Tax=Rhipicephalus sanguineus TaxID=34632 RepID=A0A9D4Q8Y5_RHISA|nr:hypothetical protein HPB52_019064 [Rhipicephalus sanguineus]